MCFIFNERHTFWSLHFLFQLLYRCLMYISYKLQYENTNYRIRSTLASNDSLVLSGSEDGRVFVWDLLEGKLLHMLQHGEAKVSGTEYQKGKKAVVSAITWNQLRNEWASAGGDGMFKLTSIISDSDSRQLTLTLRYCYNLGYETIVAG